ncbi:rhodanese-like domain-containing protein [Acidovorax sp. D2M1]|uniref:Rhodanese-like domain-containing protein n=1 Tax=Acidovorax benzenivorans TaxID=2987520 RepID=A0ABT5RZM1_9BURK|nr:rhodanese-like domain-containing protein [Acidovorax benzenivorans]MDD2179144.1 rhodanese-like domain-containing protein [Acidovorax benzenivorans]
MSTANTSHTPLVVDVRSQGEFAAGHVAGSINLPLDTFTQQAISALPDRNRPLVLCCLSGARSGMAAQWLQAQGYTQVANGGGVSSVALRLGLPMERG